MKTKIKLLVYLFAVTIFYTFTSCEKELFENQIVQESKNQNKINYITGAEASKVIENLTNNIQNYNSSNRGGTINYGTIDYSHVMKVVDTIGNKNYTFKVSHPDASFTKFYNIVLQEKIDGQSLIKLFEYNMTEDFAQKLMEGTKTLSNFEGNFEF